MLPLISVIATMTTKNSGVHVLVVISLYLLIMPSTAKVTSMSRELAGITKTSGAGGQYSKECGSGTSFSFNTPNKDESVQYEEFISFEAASEIEGQHDEEEGLDDSNVKKVGVVGNRLVATSALSDSFQGDGPLQCRACANDAADALLVEFLSYLESRNQISKDDAEKLVASFNKEKSDKIRNIKQSSSRDIVLEEKRTGIASMLSFSCNQHFLHTSDCQNLLQRVSSMLQRMRAMYEW